MRISSGLMGLFSLLCFPVFAQQVTFRGAVSDAQTGEPLTGVILMIKSREGVTRQFTTSDTNGQFSLQTAPLVSTDSLFASLIGYDPLAVIPQSDKPMALRLNPAPLNLREVTIRAPKIQMKRDTIVYNVSSFAEAQDRNLGDVIKKMPGIDIDKAGRIKYNGTPINKMYIEGIDMLDGKHSLATQNLPPADVKSVEVLENHQPIKALQDISFSEEAALNITLQEGAKAKWVGTAALAGWLPACWDAHLFAMRFSPKWQSLNTLKSNNTGTEIANESPTYFLKDYVTVGVSQAPLEAYRVRMNQSGLFNTAHTIKLSEDYQLTLQASAFNEHITSSFASQTTYYLEDSTFSIVEQENAAATTKTVSAQARLLANTPSFYLENKLTGFRSWDAAQVALTGSSLHQEAFQSASTHLDNHFQFTKRTGRHALHIVSLSQMESKPQYLTVSQQQDIQLRAFQTNTWASYGFKWGTHWALSLRGGFSAFARSLESNLTGISQLTYTDLYLQPSLKYQSNRVVATLELQGHYYHCAPLDASSGDPRNDLVGRPRIYAQYKITPRLTLSANGTLGKNPVSEHDIYQGILFSDYRHMKQGMAAFSYNQAASLSGGFSYKDPINNFFFNGNLLRAWNTSPFLTSQTYRGEYILTTYLPQTSQSRLWNASLSGNKGFYGINGVVGLEVNVSSQWATLSQSVQEEGDRGPAAEAATETAAEEIAATPYRATTYSLRPRFNGRLAPWLLLEYQLALSRSVLAMHLQGPASSVALSTNRTQSLQQTLSCTLSPIKPLSINLIAEHYGTQIATSTYKHTVLADVKIRYSLSKHLEITFTATNLLNQKTYAFTRFNGPSAYSASYQIRPLTMLVGIYWR